MRLMITRSWMNVTMTMLVGASGHRFLGAPHLEKVRRFSRDKRQMGRCDLERMDARFLDWLWFLARTPGRPALLTHILEKPHDENPGRADGGSAPNSPPLPTVWDGVAAANWTEVGGLFLGLVFTSFASQDSVGNPEFPQ